MVLMSFLNEVRQSYLRNLPLLFCCCLQLGLRIIAEPLLCQIQHFDAALSGRAYNIDVAEPLLVLPIHLRELSANLISCVAHSRLFACCSSCSTLSDARMRCECLSPIIGAERIPHFIRSGEQNFSRFER